MSQTKAIIYATATLAGTVIGAGLFALPYATLHVGIWTMLGYFLVLGSLAILLHVFFGELSLHTPDFKRMPGFAKIYLGSWGQRVAFCTTTVGLLGALLAYLILGGQFFFELGFATLGGTTVSYTILYFVLASALIFFGIKAIAKVELWGVLAFLFILLFVFLRGQPFLEPSHLVLGSFSWELLFLPYGIILFSLWGTSLIPEAEEILGVHKRMLLKVIPLALLIPVGVYLVFIYLILGITGQETTENALSGLRIVLGDGIITAVLLFGLMTAFTSFLTLGLTLKKVLWYDLGLKEHAAWAVTCFVPMALFLLGVQDFISVIGFLGAVMIGFDGILILLMYRKLQNMKLRELSHELLSPHERARMKRERVMAHVKIALAILLMIVLVAGIFFEVVSFV